MYCAYHATFSNDGMYVIDLSTAYIYFDLIFFSLTGCICLTGSREEKSKKKGSLLQVTICFSLPYYKYIFNSQCVYLYVCIYLI